ncbi:MAG: hypothetical protein AB7T05_11235, partial [Fimbriimonadaceae bacterium]
MTLTALSALFAATATAGIGLVANVQDKSSAAPGSQSHTVGGCGKHGMMGRYAEEIGLTDGQKAQMKALRDQTKAQIQKLKSNDSLDDEAKRTAWKQLRQERDVQFQNILSPEQKAKIETLKAEAKAKHAERKAAFEKNLGLTAEQKAEIEKIKAELKAKISELKSSDGFCREALRAQMDVCRSRVVWV